ncbi:MAG: methyltransferase [Chloroflexia bacterium]
MAPGGCFYVVANQFLPYERVLREALGQVEEVTRREGFKVLLARAEKRLTRRWQSATDRRDRVPTAPPPLPPRPAKDRAGTRR